jgi:hypothetical protein
MTMTALSPPKHRSDAGWRGTRRRSIVAHASRYLGALAVLATGIAHIEQDSVDDYSTVPTIGTLSLSNFVAASVIAVGLIAPLRRITGRHTDLVFLAAFLVANATDLRKRPTSKIRPRSSRARPY